MSNLLTPKKCLFSVVKKHNIFHSIYTIRRKKSYLTLLNTLNYAFSLFFVHFSPFLNLFNIWTKTGIYIFSLEKTFNCTKIFKIDFSFECKNRYLHNLIEYAEFDHSFYRNHNNSIF